MPFKILEANLSSNNVSQIMMIFIFFLNRELKKIIDQLTYARQLNTKCKNEEKSSQNFNEEWMNMSPYEQSVVSGQALKLRKDLNFTLDHLSKTIQLSKRRKRRVLKKRNSYHFTRKIDENNDLIKNLEQLWPAPIFDVLNLGKRISLKKHNQF